MAAKIFVNLPIKDLNTSVDFFTKLNFTFNPQFTDENSTCMVVSDDIFVMLLVEKFFKTFTLKEIGDTSKNTEVILSLSADSREKVDEMINKAVQAGGRLAGSPQDVEGMYSRGFQDSGGHLWEFMVMDMSFMSQGEER